MTPRAAPRRTAARRRPAGCWTRMARLVLRRAGPDFHVRRCRWREPPVAINPSIHRFVVERKHYSDRRGRGPPRRRWSQPLSRLRIWLFLGLFPADFALRDSFQVAPQRRRLSRIAARAEAAGSRRAAHFKTDTMSDRGAGRGGSSHPTRARELSLHFPASARRRSFGPVPVPGPQRPRNSHGWRPAALDNCGAGV